MNVEVFRTNVHEVAHASQMKGVLLQQFPGTKINFDLYDCDKILRMEGAGLCTEKVMNILSDHGFFCDLLD
ncbi:MAG TPA: hypothetical protein VGC95_00490 [Chitinophagaceae bacterium]